MRKCGKILYIQTGERWHNVVHRLCVLDSCVKNIARLFTACARQHVTCLCHNMYMYIARLGLFVTDCPDSSR